MWISFGGILCRLISGVEATIELGIRGIFLGNEGGRAGENDWASVTPTCRVFLLFFFCFVVAFFIPSPLFGGCFHQLAHVSSFSP